MEYGSLRHYTGNRKGKGRFYLGGVERLAELTGYSERQVRRILQRLYMRKGKPDRFRARDPRSRGSLEVIYLRHRGYRKGDYSEGHSILELAHNKKRLASLRHEAHRKPPKRPRYPHKRGPSRGKRSS